MRNIKQLIYDPISDRIKFGDWELHCGDSLEVLIPDHAGNGVWRAVSFEYDSKGWYIVAAGEGAIGVQPVGLWAREFG